MSSEGGDCTVHAAHAPHVAGTDRHHIWPQGDGGPDVEANVVVICPTGHRNLHELLEAYRRAAGAPHWSVLQHFGKAERELARRGWVGITSHVLAP